MGPKITSHLREKVKFLVSVRVLVVVWVMVVVRVMVRVRVECLGFDFSAIAI